MVLLVLGQIGILFDASIPSEVVLLGIWLNVEIIHIYVPANKPESSQGVSQEVVFQPYGIFDDLRFGGEGGGVDSKSRIWYQKIPHWQ